MKKIFSALSIATGLSLFLVQAKNNEDRKTANINRTNYQIVTEPWTSSIPENLIKNKKEVVVAIIDTGMDIEHIDLKNHIWSNPKETLNGIDDDKNGFIDDINGWDFVTNTNEIFDRHGHGTHIAGIVSKVGANSKANVSLMVLKYFDPKYNAHDNVESLVKAIHYAIDMGADIINYSGGGLIKNKAEELAIMRAYKKGILFVSAAGNESSNSDEKAFYPADYDIDGIVSVSAIDNNNDILITSNYGIKTVDIVAPGNEIESTLPMNSYGKMTGTSQATAFVTGVAAALLSQYPESREKPLVLKKYLLLTGNRVEAYKEKIFSGAKLNKQRAISMKGSDLSATDAIVDYRQSAAEKYYMVGP